MAVRLSVPLSVAAAGALTIAVWLGGGGTALSMRVPGMDRLFQEVGSTGRPAPELGRLATGDAVPAVGIGGSWPCFRDADRDGISRETVPLARTWPQGGPPLLWARDLGEGHAGPAVLNGRVYLLDYDVAQKTDVIRCLSLADGAEIWNYAYPVKVKRNHGMSRTVPAVTDEYVVTMGPKCHVTCLNSVTGEFIWAKDLVNDFGTRVPPWYAGQCPLVENGRAVLAHGGNSLMMAVECETGRIAWETPNPWKWEMTHSSITPVDFKGRRMYVYCASGGVAGVDAATGELLWKTDAWKIAIANIPSPVHVGDGRILLCGGYNSGAMMLALEENNGVFFARELYRKDPADFGCEQHTPVCYDGYLYAVRSDGRLVCMEPAGELQWTSGDEERFYKGYGPWLAAAGMLFVMDSEGVLTLAAAGPDGYMRLARARVLDGHDAWGPMALVSGRLLVRDLTVLKCYDVRAESGR
ncbi:MAG: PQQ-like beta-propeller repeat protein [Planctomycetes bacterium]|nr:PQQ-like beta-propeller repeat protein [Planctomycetota bacterium]